MTIREYAKSVGHEVVGKLTRRPEFEKFHEKDNKDRRYRFYLDEARNEYWVDTKSLCPSCNVCIVTWPDGRIL